LLRIGYRNAAPHHLIVVTIALAADHRDARGDGLSGPSKFLNELLGCKRGIRLRCVIIRRNKAGSRPAPDKKSGMRIRGYGRSPMPRTALVRHDRILGDVGHDTFWDRPRACDAAMSMAVLKRLRRPYISSETQVLSPHSHSNIRNVRPVGGSSMLVTKRVAFRILSSAAKSAWGDLIFPCRTDFSALPCGQVNYWIRNQVGSTRVGVP
jgi:hypothetical protein